MFDSCVVPLIMFLLYEVQSPSRLSSYATLSLFIDSVGQWFSTSAGFLESLGKLFKNIDALASP